MHFNFQGLACCLVVLFSSLGWALEDYFAAPRHRDPPEAPPPLCRDHNPSCERANYLEHAARVNPDGREAARIRAEAAENRARAGLQDHGNNPYAYDTKGRYYRGPNPPRRRWGETNPANCYGCHVVDSNGNLVHLNRGNTAPPASDGSQ